MNEHFNCTSSTIFEVWLKHGGIFLIDQWEQLKHARSLKHNVLIHHAWVALLNFPKSLLSSEPLWGFIGWIKMSLRGASVVNLASCGFLGKFSFLNSTFSKETSIMKRGHYAQPCNPTSNQRQTKLWFLNALTVADKAGNFISTKFSDTQLFPCQLPSCNAYQCPRHTKDKMKVNNLPTEQHLLWVQPLMFTSTFPSIRGFQ